MFSVVLAAVVGGQIEEPRGDERAVSVDDHVCVVLDGADRGDAVVTDADVAGERRGAETDRIA